MHKEEPRAAAHNSTSLARSQFPYECFDREGWEEAVLAKLQRASEEPGVSGAFLLVAVAHGYIFQHLAICLDDNKSEGVVWASVTGNTQSGPITFKHDPAQSLDHLRSIWQDRQVVAGTTRDSKRGRDVTLFIAAGGQGAWLRCQAPFEDAADDDELDSLILDLQAIPNTRAR